MHGSTSAATGVRQLALLARDSVRDLPALSGFAPRPEAEGLVNLRFNENVFAGAYLRYPEHDVSELCCAYRAALDAVDPLDSPADDVGLALTRGAVDAMDLVVRAFFEPGRDRIVVPHPGFGMTARLAALAGVGCDRAHLGGEGFDRLDTAGIMARRPKGVLLCDPNNPTSTQLDPGDVVRLLDRFDGLVVIDETYAEVAPRRSHRHLQARYPRLILLRSMSKGLGMAGLRLGAVLAHPELLAAVRAVQQPFAVPAPVLEAALAELGDHDLLRQRIGGFTAERDRLAARLRRLPGIGRVFAAAGFLAVEVADAARTQAVLRSAGFATVPEPEGWPGFLRISVGTPVQNEGVIAALAGKPSPTSGPETAVPAPAGRG